MIDINLVAIQWYIMCAAERGDTTASGLSEPQEDNGTSPHIPRYDGAKVLVVDDERVALSILQAILHNYGCQVDVMPDPDEAVKLCQEIRYDLIFLDIKMPKMSGYKLANRMRLIDGMRRKPPIVAVSVDLFRDSNGHICIRDRENCLREGMDECLPKPVRPEPVAQLLKKFLSEMEKHPDPNPA